MKRKRKFRTARAAYESGAAPGSVVGFLLRCPWIPLPQGQVLSVQVSQVDALTSNLRHAGPEFRRVTPLNPRVLIPSVRGFSSALMVLEPETSNIGQESGPSGKHGGSDCTEAKTPYMKLRGPVVETLYHPHAIPLKGALTMAHTVA